MIRLAFGSRRQQLATAVVLALISGWFHFAPLAVLADDPKEAVALNSQASESQIAGDNKFAAESWEKLIKDFPNCSFADKALYNCGVCYINLGEFAKAEKKFDAAIKSTSKKTDFAFREASHLYLGFSQYSQGQKEKDKTKSELLYKNAIAAFDEMLSKFQSGKYKDQALMFRGESYDALKKYPKAAENYQQIIDNFPNSTFFIEAHFALAAAQQQMKQYEQAEKIYAQYIAKAIARNEKAESDNKLQKIDPNRIENARMQIADTLLDRGNLAGENGDKDLAKEFFAKAEKIYAQLASKNGFLQRDRCLLQQANCQIELGDSKTAGDLFAKLVSDLPKSEYVAEATIQAGRSYYNVDAFALANQWLEKARLAGGKFAAEAAHWQCLLLIRQKKYVDAEELCTKALQDVEEIDPYFVELKLDQANALYHQADKREQSIAKYIAIVDEYPKNQRAGESLYNAAYACQEELNWQKAIELAGRFEKEFKTNIYLPDVLEVKADSFIQLQKYADAEKVFAILVADHARHKNFDDWQVRRAATQYFQNKHKEVVAGLEKSLANIKSKETRSQGYYWLGASQFESGEIEDAKTSLTSCLELNPQNPRAGEATVMLARAQFNDGKKDAAIKTAEDALEKYGDKLIADQIRYRLAEFYYDAGKFEQAADQYVAVITSDSNEELIPHSIYGLAWSQLKQQQLDSAIATFSQLLDKFPQHSLVADAQLGRGMTYRQQGLHSKAIADLEKFIKTDAPKDKKTAAQFEIALSQVDSKKYDQAIASFQSLIAADPDSKIADRCLYEMAWAYRSSDKKSESLQQFAKLTKDFPDSPFAAEAYFHRGQAKYENGDYDSAITNYQKCLAKTDNKSHAEKSMYRLGWSQYQKKQYADAEKTFRDQSKKYADGELYADGLFMISECLFRQNKFKDAVTAYKFASPEVADANTTTDVKMQTLLHGAQSANKSNQFDDAIAFAEKVVDRSTTDSYTYDAWLELGLARKGKNELKAAIDAFAKAAGQFNKTGAQSRCLIGEVHFQNKEYDKAIMEFKKVIYGYGGTRADESVKPHQAFAAYEAGRCNMVLISMAKDDAAKKQLIDEAKKMFKLVVDNHSKNPLASDANQQLVQLNKM